MNEESYGAEGDGEEIQPLAKNRPVNPGESFYLMKVSFSNETVLCRVGDFPNLRFNDEVIIQGRNGQEQCRLLGRIKAENSLKWSEIFEIVRLCTEADEKTLQENKKKEKYAYTVGRQKIEEHKLDMKLVSVHYVLDEAKIIFFFTSENRVDFRELVRDLVAVFHLRIELRQIGVRDESRMTGGKGVCGRCLCCNAVSDKLQPVSIKMAKVQSLSLNSMKISGPCGRLLCCLAYEYEAYRCDRKELPGEGCVFQIEGIGYRVRDVNVLSRVLVLHGDDGSNIAVPAKYFRLEGNFWRFTESSLAACQVVPVAFSPAVPLLE